MGKTFYRLAVSAPVLFPYMEQIKRVKKIHAFGGVRGKKKSKLPTQLFFTCLFNVPPQIQLSQCSETRHIFRIFLTRQARQPSFSFHTVFSSSSPHCYYFPKSPNTWLLMIKAAGAVSWWRIHKHWTLFPPPLGLPIATGGWLYKCSNHHQTFPQMEIDTWSIQRSLHYHICLFGSVFKFILLLYHPSSFMFSGMQR